MNTSFAKQIVDKSLEIINRKIVEKYVEKYIDPRLETFSDLQQSVIYDAVEKTIKGKSLVLSTDLNGIYNALEYACSFINAGRDKMDDVAHKQLLNAMEQIRRYSIGETDSAADLTAESNDPRSHIPITFKVDGVPVRVGQDMKVEYDNKEEGLTLIVTLTQEGIIMDLWELYDSEPTATSSIMYSEKIQDMIGD